MAAHVVGAAGGPTEPIAAFLFGLNLLVTCMWFNMNHNDAFSAMQLFDYRHFLRIRILGDTLTVYPVKLAKPDFVGKDAYLRRRSGPP